MDNPILSSFVRLVFTMVSEQMCNYQNTSLWEKKKELNIAVDPGGHRDFAK